MALPIAVSTGVVVIVVAIALVLIVLTVALSMRRRRKAQLDLVDAHERAVRAERDREFAQQQAKQEIDRDR